VRAARILLEDAKGNTEETLERVRHKLGIIEGYIQNEPASGGDNVIAGIKADAIQLLKKAQCDFMIHEKLVYHAKVKRIVIKATDNMNQDMLDKNWLDEIDSVVEGKAAVQKAHKAIIDTFNKAGIAISNLSVHCCDLENVKETRNHYIQQLKKEKTKHLKNLLEERVKVATLEQKILISELISEGQGLEDDFSSIQDGVCTLYLQLLNICGLNNDLVAQGIAGRLQTEVNKAIAKRRAIVEEAIVKRRAIVEAEKRLPLRQKEWRERISRSKGHEELSRTLEAAKKAINEPLSTDTEDTKRMKGDEIAKLVAYADEIKNGRADMAKLAIKAKWDGWVERYRDSDNPVTNQIHEILMKNGLQRNHPLLQETLNKIASVVEQKERDDLTVSIKAKLSGWINHAYHNGRSRVFPIQRKRSKKHTKPVSEKRAAFTINPLLLAGIRTKLEEMGADSELCNQTIADIKSGVKDLVVADKQAENESTEAYYKAHDASLGALAGEDSDSGEEGNDKVQGGNRISLFNEARMKYAGGAVSGTTVDGNNVKPTVVF